MTREEFNKIYEEAIKEQKKNTEIRREKIRGGCPEKKKSLEISLRNGWIEGRIQEPMLDLALFALLSDKDMLLYFEKIIQQYEATHSFPMGIDGNPYPAAIIALKKFITRFHEAHYGAPIDALQTEH